MKAGRSWCGERAVDSCPELDAESDKETVVEVKAEES